MEVRDALEADAEALAGLADQPADVMRNIVHERSVRVAVAADDATASDAADDATASDAADDDREVRAYVAFDVRDGAVHVTGFGGDAEATERLFEEPLRFAAGEGMSAEVLVEEDDEDGTAVVEAAGFERVGTGPRFAGQRTLRYRADPDSVGDF